MRGEWIEMQEYGNLKQLTVSLSPCGESGLKLESVVRIREHIRSLPMRGEWIEMLQEQQTGVVAAVSPHAGRVD